MQWLVELSKLVTRSVRKWKRSRKSVCNRRTWRVKKTKKNRKVKMAWQIHIVIIAKGKRRKRKRRKQTKRELGL